MSSKSKLKPVALAAGVAFATGMLLSTASQAAENPFAMTHLESGYKLADNRGIEGNCGANKAKAKEANCGSNKVEKQVPKLKEGKCGEGKCGTNKKQ